MRASDSSLATLWQRTSFGGVLLLVLLIANIFLNPPRFVFTNWGTLIGLAAPLIGAAIASTPAILAGRGGLDLSVGPLMGFVNAIVIKVLFLDNGIASPFVIVPVALITGLVVGCINGFLAAVLRIQPIVATLGTFLVLTGVTLTILPAPLGPAPDWLKSLAGPLSIVPLAAIFLIWAAVKRLPIFGQLMAVGSDDRAAFTAGVPVTQVRFFAYAFGGMLSGIAGLMLTSLIGSADPNIGPTFTLTAIAAVALGGVSLAGGRGSITGATTGALVIFLLQSVLTTFNVSTHLLQLANGAILVTAVVLTALQDRLQRGGAR